MQGSTEVLVSWALAEDRHILGLQRGEGGLPRGGLHLEVASTEEDAWPHQVIIAKGLRGWSLMQDVLRVTHGQHVVINICIV